MIRRIGVLTLIMGAALSAYAAENQSVLALSPSVQRGDIYQPKGFWPLLGVGLGAMDRGDNTRTGGMPGHIKALGSYYFEGAPIVGDLGLGLHNQFLTQKGPGSDTIQSLYTEVAGRYQFTNRWQLGAIWNTLVDNPDRYRSNTDNLASFVGAQVLKEFTWQEQYLVRVGGRAMTSVGLSGGSVNTVMAELEVSFGPGRTEVVEEKPAPTVTAPHLASRAMKTYDLDPKLVHFDTDSTQLVKSSDQYFKRLARALAANHELFNRVEVVGHADQRGPDSYNNRLSVNRAKAVSQRLVSAGVRTSQIEVEGKGKRELLSHSMKPAALQLNRRVQLQFHGVTNQEALQNIIDSATR